MLEQLEVLANKFNDDEGISLMLVKGNFIGLILSIQIKKENDAHNYFKRISLLAEKFPDNGDIQDVYINAINILHRV
jgi:hypothetical protein